MNEIEYSYDDNQTSCGGFYLRCINRNTAGLALIISLAKY